VAAFRTLDDLTVAGQRVLVRVDLNVPMKNGKVGDATRIASVVPTLAELAAKGAKVVVLSHFGRPDGKPVPAMSLKPLAEVLAAALKRPVAFAGDCIGPAAAAAVTGLKNGDVALLENTRFHPGEEANDAAFTAALAANGDIYVNEAFSCAHRAHASTEGLAHRLPSAAGRCMETELASLTKALEKPARPLVALVGGAKISTKLDVLGNLVAKVDKLIVGGAMANTFLLAQGIAVGKSLCERDLLPTAKAILAKAKAANCELVLPDDVVVAPALRPGVTARAVAVADVPADELILDIGPRSAERLGRLLGECKTLVWNGPLGAFETPPFDAATVAVARAAAKLAKAGKLFAIAGGGDTVAALNHAGVAGDFSYISTAGGAFLEWLEGKPLPGVKALLKREKSA
jgi:phosphoglycerate kinase